RYSGAISRHDTVAVVQVRQNSAPGASQPPSWRRAICACTIIRIPTAADAGQVASIYLIATTKSRGALCGGVSGQGAYPKWRISGPREQGDYPPVALRHARHRPFGHTGNSVVPHFDPQRTGPSAAQAPR